MAKVTAEFVDRRNGKRYFPGDTIEGNDDELRAFRIAGVVEHETVSGLVFEVDDTLREEIGKLQGALIDANSLVANHVAQLATVIERAEKAEADLLVAVERATRAEGERDAALTRASEAETARDAAIADRDAMAAERTGGATETAQTEGAAAVMPKSRSRS